MKNRVAFVKMLVNIVVKREVSTKNLETLRDVHRFKEYKLAGKHIKRKYGVSLKKTESTTATVVAVSNEVKWQAICYACGLDNHNFLNGNIKVKNVSYVIQ